MNSRSFTIRDLDRARPVVRLALDYLQQMLMHGPARITLAHDEDEMTDAQRGRLNAMCGDLSKQIRLDWQTGAYVHVSKAPGGRKLSKDDWRHMMVAVVKGQTSVPHPEGNGFIVLGQSSKNLGKRLTNECISLIDAFGSMRGVQWSDPGQPDFEDYQNTPHYHRHAA